MNNARMLKKATVLHQLDISGQDLASVLAHLKTGLISCDSLFA